MPELLTQPQTGQNTLPPAKPPRRFLVNGKKSLLQPLGRCPKSQTLLGTDVDDLCYVIAELPCRNWACRPCAETKIRRLAALTRDAKPSRMLTLTVNPSCWESPRAAFDGTRRQVPELLRRLRKQFGEIEYLRVTELTANGWPHYHLLLRSDFIPHAVVKSLWKELTGAWIVDLRQVNDTFRAYTYLVKYLSKLHKIEWTARHVSYSKNFFLPEPDRKNEPLPLERVFTINMHPITYLLSHHKNDSIEAFTPSSWKIIEASNHDDF